MSWYDNILTNYQSNAVGITGVLLFVTTRAFLVEISPGKSLRRWMHPGPRVKSGWEQSVGGRKRDFRRINHFHSTYSHAFVSCCPDEQFLRYVAIPIATPSRKLGSLDHSRAGSMECLCAWITVTLSRT
ncbi:hypothetical protein BDR07DRAFT_1399660 [Suillus spraguei]|nr:hypothetical protein BDR07DRAFT_1399660 [Suillus spraguei]